MILVVDVGNTNITCGVYGGKELKATFRINTKTQRTSDEYGAIFSQLLSMKDLGLKDIEGSIIASVVPDVMHSLVGGIVRYTNTEPLIVGPGVKTGLNIKIDNPAQLGADLVAGAVGAISEYTLPCVVIDMGTASTISVIDRNGAYLGGVISAGVRLTLKALCENTSLLPSIEINAPTTVIGTNTVDCMKSGLIFGTAAMIDGLLDKITEELGEIPTVVATGGLSKEIIAHCNSEIIYNANLLLDGLREIYDKNR